MTRKALVLLLLFLVAACACAPATPLPSPSLSPDASTENAYAATFSIVAYDPVKKEWGVAVASKFLGVGGVVPHAQAGAGAVATQASVNYTLGPKGVELLAAGKTAAEALDELKKLDKGIEIRQLGLVDRNGDAVTFTGKRCIPWAGGKTGKYYACQGNILAAEEVINAMAKAYEASEKSPLAWRLFAALEAADRAGGDKRGKQSAAVLVVRDRGGYNGFGDRYVDLRVDDSEKPVEELARILAKRVRRPKAAD